MRIVRLGWLIALGAIACSTPAMAENERGSFAVRAYVPEYCEIETAPIYLDNSAGSRVAQVFEACNTLHGFQVVASYRTLHTQENIELTYAGTTSRLNTTGWTPVANRSGAKLGTRQIGIRYENLEQPVAITLALTYL